MRWRHATEADLVSNVSQEALEAVRASEREEQARATTSVIGTPLDGRPPLTFASYKEAHAHLGGKYASVRKGIARAIESGRDWHSYTWQLKDE